MLYMFCACTLSQEVIKREVTSSGFYKTALGQIYSLEYNYETKNWLNPPMVVSIRKIKLWQMPHQKTRIKKHLHNWAA